MEFTIQHDKEQYRFYVNISGEVCELKYKKIDDSTLDYYSTFVPESLRHKGIAGKLTAYALDYAKFHQYHVIPSCPFVKKYASEHPEYAKLIKN